MYSPVISLYFEGIEEFERDDAVACKCQSCEDSDKCECLRQFGRSYGENKRLINVDDDCKPIVECSRFCKCDETCSNRVVQLGSKFKLEIFNTEDKGLGVRTQEFISKGCYIAEYLGELVNESCDGAYVLQAREHTSSGVYITTLDATRIGNLARFFNHSCSPNMCLVPVRSYYILPNIAFFAKRDIFAYEELTFKYSEVNKGRKCYCRSLECAGYY